MEYIETANTAMDITRMKKAESLSTKKPKFRNEVPERVKLKVSPKTTDSEKMIPKTDADSALKKEVYNDRRSFLLNTTADAAPAKQEIIIAKNSKYVLTIIPPDDFVFIAFRF